MMKRILLVGVNASDKEFQTKRWGIHPLGLMYIAASVRAAFEDVEIRIFDTILHSHPKEALAIELETFSPDIVGMRSLSLFRDEFSGISAIIRSWRPDCPIIGGGPFVSSSYPELLEKSIIDVAVLREGERTFVDLLHHLRTGEKLPRHLEGTAVMADGAVRLNPDRPRIENLDDNPFPAYDLIDIDEYAKIRNASQIPPDRCAYIESSRGCPFKCFYCHIAKEKSVRQRSPWSVVSEMQARRDQYGVDSFIFLDDLFNMPMDRAKETLKMIHEQLPGVQLHFPNGLRADHLDHELLDLFEAAGTVHMALAMETVTQRLQKLIGKFLDVEKATRMMEAASRRFLCTGFFLLGLPTETREEAKATIDFARGLTHLWNPILSVVRVYPNTRMWNYLDPDPEQAAALIRQTAVPTASRFHTKYEDHFYGDIFPEEKVPLTLTDIRELRMEWMQAVHFNPKRILISYELMGRFLTREEIVTVYQSLQNNESFSDRKLQIMLDYAHANLPQLATGTA